MRSCESKQIQLRPGMVCKVRCWPDQTHCIYGLFDKDGHCFYVGRSRNIFNRSGSHFRNPMFKPIIDSCRVLRWCRREECGRLEFQIVRALQRRGEAQHNEHNGTPRSEITKSRARKVVLAVLSELNEQSVKLLRNTA